MLKTKKLLCLLLALALLLSFAGCSEDASSSGQSQPSQEEPAPPTVQEQFDDYISALPAKLFEHDTLSLRFKYRDPETAGIPAGLPTDYVPTREEWDRDNAELQEICDTLLAFDTAQLDEASLLTLEILLDSFERDLLLKDFYLLSGDYLGSYLGAQADLPLLLTEYPIAKEADLEDYFLYLATIPGSFERYVEVERLRQEAEVGLSADMVELVIEQCDNLVEGDHSFIYDATDLKIDAIDTMDDQAKAAAKEENRRLVDEHVIQAYRDLAQALAQLDAPQENRGLSLQPGGEDYYAALIRLETGLDMTPDEVATFLNERFNANISRLLDLYATVTDADLDALDARLNAQFNEMDPQAVMDYMIESYAQYYPTAGAMPYKITAVPEAMSENFSPAAFMIPALDLPDGEAYSIHVNYFMYEDRDASDLFTTLVHEGVPGHMYQTRYAYELELPDVRKLMMSRGYVEGWANYVESRSYEFLPEEYRDAVEFVNRDSKLWMIISAMANLGVHDLGWGAEELAGFQGALYGVELTVDDVMDWYLQILETPVNSIYYILTSEKLEQLRETTEEALGDAFDPVEFHEVILGLGAASLSVVEKHVDAYIEENRPADAPLEQPEQSPEEQSLKDAA